MNQSLLFRKLSFLTLGLLATFLLISIVPILASMPCSASQIGIAETIVGNAVGRRLVGIDAQEMAGFYLPAGFLEGFASHRIQDGFIFLDVAGGLVKDDASATDFLNHEKAPGLVLNDHGDGGMGCPGHGARNLLRRWAGTFPGLAGAVVAAGECTVTVRYSPGRSPSKVQSPIR